MIVFALAGAGTGTVDASALALGTALFALTTAFSLFLYHRGLIPALASPDRSQAR
jgi:hypothetical protein